MWSPVPFGDRFVCDFAIDGLPDTVRSSSENVDTLAAIVSALQAIHYLLEPHRDQLAWFDERGDTGVPYVITHFSAAEQRRLEFYVKAEAERSVTEFNANHPATHWEKRNIERYDCGAAGIDYAAYSTTEVVHLLRAAAVRASAFRRAGNTDAWFVFSRKQTNIFISLLKRPQLADVLRELTELRSDDERALRFQAADLLHFQFGYPTGLERLADEMVDPEATQARMLLEQRARAAARPKPWDEAGQNPQRSR